MVEVSRRDPYLRSKYDLGIDAKIVIMGSTGVGKTSLLRRFTQNKFEPRNTTTTTGASFVTKKVNVDGTKVRLQLWDTAGQERFRSMAPMYYRGANAALLLYDITNADSFQDIRGWLEELKSNCSPDLIIYIVGSKADLHRERRITPDLARLSLHNWFPPPQPPSPPPPPPPSSTFSYIRPRFTSFTSIRSVPLAFPSKPPLTPSCETDDSHGSQSSGGGARSTTAPQSYIRPRSKSGGVLLQRAHTTSIPVRPTHTRYGSHAGYGGQGWNNDHGYSSSNSYNEEEEDQDDVDSREWGLEKGMDLFEVSAKDATGIQDLFDTLIAAIIARKDIIEEENELKKRDSVFLTPAWAAQADAEETRQKAAAAAKASWSCCSV